VKKQATAAQTAASKDPIRVRLAHATHGVDVFRFGSGTVIQVLRADLKTVLDELDELIPELLKTRDSLVRAKRVVEAARSFRTADTGGGFNDRVACGRALDEALAALEKRT
jgi:hypothetical protein